MWQLFLQSLSSPEVLVVAGIVLILLIIAGIEEIKWHQIKKRYGEKTKKD